MFIATPAGRVGRCMCPRFNPELLLRLHLLNFLWAANVLKKWNSIKTKPQRHFFFISEHRLETITGWCVALVQISEVSSGSGMSSLFYVLCERFLPQCKHPLTVWRRERISGAFSQSTYINHVYNAVKSISLYLDMTHGTGERQFWDILGCSWTFSSDSFLTVCSC